LKREYQLNLNRHTTPDFYKVEISIIVRFRSIWFIE